MNSESDTSQQHCYVFFDAQRSRQRHPSLGRIDDVPGQGAQMLSLGSCLHHQFEAFLQMMATGSDKGYGDASHKETWKYYEIY